MYYKIIDLGLVLLFPYLKEFVLNFFLDLQNNPLCYFVELPVLNECKQPFIAIPFYLSHAQGMARFTNLF